MGGFPDDAILNHTFDGVCLRDHLGGIFVAGGGDITREQVEIYKLRAAGRPGDYFQPANALDGTPSKLNEVLLTGNVEDAEEEMQKMQKCGMEDEKEAMDSPP